MVEPDLELEPSDKSPEYFLWLHVTLDAVETLKRYGYNKASSDFLFDPENQFFILVCDELGYSPDILRTRISAMVKAPAS